MAARRGRVEAVEPERVEAGADLPEWIEAATPAEAPQSPPETPRPLPSEAGAEAVTRQPRGPAEEIGAAMTEVEETASADAAPAMSKNERAMRRRLAASGFVALDGDETPPNTPHATYRMASLRGGSVREPVPRWRW